MKLSVQILAYNVSRFIGPAIENVGPHVDHIYIAYSPRAFGYNPERRDVANRTTREELLATRFAGKTVIVEGDWLLEEDARNACLDQARKDGCDYMLVQDADEFFPQESWSANKAILSAPRESRVFKAAWYNFWRTTGYVIQYEDGGVIGTNATYALPCDGSVRFLRKRMTDAKQVHVLPGVCFHYGYVLTDEEMLEKVSTWSHTNDMFFLRGWYWLKWLAWSPESRNLHVVFPPEWPRAVAFQGEIENFGTALEVEHRPRTRNVLVGLADRAYDFGVTLRVAARRLKRGVVRLLRKLTAARSGAA